MFNTFTIIKHFYLVTFIFSQKLKIGKTSSKLDVWVVCIIIASKDNTKFENELDAEVPEIWTERGGVGWRNYGENNIKSVASNSSLKVMLPIMSVLRPWSNFWNINSQKRLDRPGCLWKRRSGPRKGILKSPQYCPGLTFNLQSVYVSKFILVFPAKLWHVFLLNDSIK